MIRNVTLFWISPDRIYVFSSKSGEKHFSDNFNLFNIMKILEKLKKNEIKEKTFFSSGFDLETLGLTIDFEKNH
jgi:hypothetical protein